MLSQQVSRHSFGDGPGVDGHGAHALNRAQAPLCSLSFRGPAWCPCAVGAHDRLPFDDESVEAAPTNNEHAFRTGKYADAEARQEREETGMR